MCLDTIDTETNLEALHKVKAYKRFSFNSLTGELRAGFNSNDERRYAVEKTYYDHQLAKRFPTFARKLRLMRKSEHLRTDERDWMFEYKTYPRGFHAFANPLDVGFPTEHKVVCEVELDNIVAMGKQNSEDYGSTYVALQMKIVRILSLQQVNELRVIQREEEFKAAFSKV